MAAPRIAWPASFANGSSPRQRDREPRVSFVFRNLPAALYQRFITPVSRAASSSAPAISNTHASQLGMALSFLCPGPPFSSMNSTPADLRHLGPSAQIGSYVCPGPNPSADQRDGSGVGKYGERTGDCCEFRLHYFRHPRSFSQFGQAVNRPQEL